ncbi:MAG: sulfatase-like hydrolase/transferase [Verrucomicrobiota bacterium]|nr:sulfatase-like hydrolase/transferase [Verrucomicrobiota bacterium]
MQSFFILFVTLIISGFVWAKQPNFVFLVSEDNSVHYLKHYGAKFGSMPNVEKMASNGLTFNHAFSNGPVCSVARSTLALGIWAPRMGIQYHRKAESVTLPKGVLPWSAILRNAGYYCANNSKQDYNFIIKGINAWDQSSKKANWRNRPIKDMPFFYMQSMGQSHESSLHFKETLMKEEKTHTPVESVKLHPYHPDTSIFRYTHARYHDRMSVIDDLIGSALEKLEEDGLLEDTFIFYFGDHGGVLPRGKGYAYESGVHVPLVVRIPKNFSHLVDYDLGTRTDGFVSFIDFGPTILNLAGIDVPASMDGKPFLGKGVKAKDLKERDEVYCYADRFDEKYDLVRTVRKGKWKYIRNYQGFYPDGLQNNYRYRMLAYEEWREMFFAGKLNDKQSQFFRPRPAEQLFDLSLDPHEVNNLSRNPDFENVLLELRSKLRKHLASKNDLSFFPESHMIENALADPLAFGNSKKGEIKALIEIADLALLPFVDAEAKINKILKSGSDWERYWACMVCSQFGEKAKNLSSTLQSLTKEKNLMVRMRAIEALALVVRKDPMPGLIDISNQSNSRIEVLLAMNSIAFFRDHCGFDLNPKSFSISVPRGEFYRRLEYFNGK